MEPTTSRSHVQRPNCYIPNHHVVLTYLFIIYLCIIDYLSDRSSDWFARACHRVAADVSLWSSRWTAVIERSAHNIGWPSAVSCWPRNLTPLSSIIWTRCLLYYVRCWLEQFAGLSLRRPTICRQTSLVTGTINTPNAVLTEFCAWGFGGLTFSSPSYM